MRKVNDNYCQLYGAIYNITTIIERDIKEFKIIVADNSFKQRGLLDIETVYMHSIIMNLSKLFSVTKSDKTGLRQLKTISPKAICNEIDRLENKHRDIIQKVSCNRNKLVAHLDISKNNAYYNMGISKIEIERIISDYKTTYHYNRNIKDTDDPFVKSIKKIESDDKNNERYSLSDFQCDIPEISNVVEVIKSINNSTFKYYRDYRCQRVIIKLTKTT